jgi:hypothetical protein
LAWHLGSWINTDAQLTNVSGAFAFNTMMIDTLIPKVNSGGTYSTNNSNKLIFSYRVLGKVSDTGLLLILLQQYPYLPQCGCLAAV